MEKKRYNEDRFYDFLKKLISSGRITDTTELGITKCCIDNGYNSLSHKQKYVFDKMISMNSIEECKMCHSDILWSEMFNALENGGLCSGCENQKKKAIEDD